MKVHYDLEQLEKLLTNLYTITGIRTCIFDLQGKLMCENAGVQPFCRMIQGEAEGKRRCRECHMREIARCAREETPNFYRCHAGAYEVILPVFSHGVLLAYLTFGQFLDDSPLDRQWEKCLRGTGWYQGDREALRMSFDRMTRWTEEEVRAYQEILNATSLYIHLSGLLDSARLTDLQRLEMYIDQHYMEKLSLTGISEALKISRTRLCAGTRENTGGKTVTTLIAERRVEAAKLLLSKTNDPISSIAEAVGIPDYNYFTKIFRKITGVTPSFYRKLYMHIE